MDNRIKCNSCRKIFEFDYRKRRSSTCKYCGSNDTEFITKMPLIYHPRQFVQWPLNFKKDRYQEILDYLKNVYRHNCKTRKEEGGSCSCKERDFQNEIIEYFLRFYDNLLNNLPLGLKATKKQERFPLGDALVIIEERPLWPPGEAITWYKHGNNLYGHPEEDMHIVFTVTKRQKDAITYRYRDSKGKI